MVIIHKVFNFLPACWPKCSDRRVCCSNSSLECTGRLVFVRPEHTRNLCTVSFRRCTTLPSSYQLN